MAVTSTVGHVTIGYSGPELVVTPAGTGNSNVDNSPAPVMGLYNPYDPTTLLQNLPVTTGYLPPPTAVTVTPNTTGSTTVGYQVVFTLGTQDGIPSSTVTITNSNATFNNTVAWAYQPGTTGAKILRGGQIIATISNPFTTSYTDANATGSAYTPSTSNPLASLAARLVDINGAAIGSTGGGLNVTQRNMTAATDVVTVVAQNGVLSDTRSTPFGAATVSVPTFNVGNNNKRLLYVVIGTPITWATSGQVTIRPYVSTSSQTASGTFAPLIDTAQNLGASGTSLSGEFVFDSATLPSFAQPHLFMGFQIVFPSTPTNAAGASIISVLNGTNT